MGVGALAGRAVRVCDIDIVGPVTLSACGGRGLLDACTPGPGLRDPVSLLTWPARVVVPLAECARGPSGSWGSMARLMSARLCVLGPRGTDRPGASLPDLMRWHAQSCVCVCMCARVSSWLYWALPAPPACDFVAPVVSDCLSVCNLSGCVCELAFVSGNAESPLLPWRGGDGRGYGTR